MGRKGIMGDEFIGKREFKGKEGWVKGRQTLLPRKGETTSGWKGDSCL